MKILLITESLDIGGIETNIIRLSKELVYNGHEVTVAARPGVLNNQLNRHEEILNILINQYPNNFEINNLLYNQYKITKQWDRLIYLLIVYNS